MSSLRNRSFQAATLAGVRRFAFLLVLPLLAAACGGGQGPGGSKTEVGAKAVQGGAVLVDSANHTLYTFSKGAGCYDACAKHWTPLVADGDVAARDGSNLDESLLGTTKRRDGTLQVTYDSQPLYYTAEATPSMQDHGGSWDVVKITGLTPQHTTTGVSCDPNCGY